MINYLGNENFYFYYLNSKNNLCEGHIESKGENKKKNYTKEFKFYTPHDFIFTILKELNPEIKDNLVIFNIIYGMIKIIDIIFLH